MKLATGILVLVVIAGSVMLAVDSMEAASVERTIEHLISHSKLHKLANKLSGVPSIIQDSDAQKCQAYAEEQHIDVSDVTSWIILYQPRHGVDCSSTCNNLYYGFSIDYKEPNICCCGTN